MKTGQSFLCRCETAATQLLFVFGLRPQSSVHAADGFSEVTDGGYMELCRAAVPLQLTAGTTNSTLHTLKALSFAGPLGAAAGQAQLH